jgi:hypothetical protein
MPHCGPCGGVQCWSGEPGLLLSPSSR